MRDFVIVMLGISAFGAGLVIFTRGAAQEIDRIIELACGPERKKDSNTSGN